MGAAVTARDAPDFAAEEKARAQLLAAAHQHLVAARGLIEQATALTAADATGRPVVKIVAYDEDSAFRPGSVLNLKSAK